MKKILLILLMSFGLYGSQTIELVGDRSYPPYSYEDNGEPKGIYVDIIKEAFNNIDGYDVKFKMVAWKRAIALVKKGDTLGFFPPYYSEERTQWTKFSEPILSEKVIVFAKEHTLKNKKNFPEDFYGLTVCMNRGFGHEVLGGVKFSNAIKENKIKLIEGNNNNACMARVVRDLADFYINDQLIDTSKFKNLKAGIKVKDNFGYLGFTLKKEKYRFFDHFEAQFNKTIKLMNANGEVEKIVNKYKNK